MMLLLKNSEILKGPLGLRLLKAANGLDADTVELLASLDLEHTSLCNELAELNRANR